MSALTTEELLRQTQATFLKKAEADLRAAVALAEKAEAEARKAEAEARMAEMVGEAVAKKIRESDDLTKLPRFS